MRSKKYQRGMSIWSMSFVVGVFAFIIFLIFKLFPPYMEYFKVVKALDSLAQSSDIAAMSKADMVTALARRFDIDNVDLDPAKNLYLEPRGRGSRLMRIHYENVVPLFYNVSLLLEFEHAKEVRGAE